MSMQADAEPLTAWLRSWSQGDGAAGSRVLDHLYGELRRVARALFARTPEGHLLQPTALVHEAYLHLSRYDRIAWKSRTHFLAVAARQMRRVLVDHCREQGARKRGGDWQRVTLSGLQRVAPLSSTELLALDQALARLAEVSALDAEIVELTVFGGLSQEEIARELGICRKTVVRRWKKARAWLYGELTDGGSRAS